MLRENILKINNIKEHTIIFPVPFMRVANPPCYNGSHSSEWVLTVVRIERGNCVCKTDPFKLLSFVWYGFYFFKVEEPHTARKTAHCVSMQNLKTWFYSLPGKLYSQLQLLLCSFWKNIHSKRCLVWVTNVRIFRTKISEYLEPK